MASISGSSATVTDDGTTVTVTFSSNGGIPGAHAASHASAGSDPITIAQSQVTDLTTDLAGKAAFSDLPRSVFIPALMKPSASSVAPLFAQASGSYLGGYVYSTSGLINTYIEWQFCCAAGTYDLRTIYNKASILGIASISIDGGSALGTTIDMYAAVSSSNNITDIAGVALTAGNHVIRYTMATKNASSSDYYYSICAVMLNRTGA